MEFIYHIPTKEYYSHRTDEIFCEEKEIHYEPEQDEVIDALASILICKCSDDLGITEYNLAMKITKHIIENEDLYDALCDKYYDELKVYFEEDAKEQWR